MPVLSKAPCSDEKLQYRIEESKNYMESLRSKVMVWDCDNVQDYRKLEQEGKGIYDAPLYDPAAVEITVPSMHRSHEVRIRMIEPKNSTPRGVFMYMHGGGFIAGSASLQDKGLRDLAEQTGLTVASVEYRLAQDAPLPACSDDCVDAALFLLSPKGEENTGCPLRFLGGESSGAYLAVQTAIRLRDKGINVRERLAGLIPTYGLYDLSELPTARFMRGPIDPHVDFLAIALPKEVRTSMDLIKHPKWSPLYADLKDLPPASFSVGTEDGLIDDTLLMAARWELAGNEAELFLYLGTTHGYLTMVRLDATEEALRDIAQFVERQLAATGST